MIELVELSSTAHKGLKTVANCSEMFAEKQQIMRLRVAEISKAATNFPIFFTRNNTDGSFVLSALCGFENGGNLFVKDKQWQATYRPTVMQTYPFFLMKSPKNENSYTIGIDEKSSGFSKKSGDTLFDDSGKASLQLSRVKSLLETDIKNDIQTYQFAQKLEQLNMLKTIDLLIHYQDGSMQTLAGLITLDEDKLHGLSAEQLHELNQQGYLVPMHAMLISIYQLNLLIRKHNDLDNINKVAQLKIEVARDRELG